MAKKNSTLYHWGPLLALSIIISEVFLTMVVLSTTWSSSKAKLFHLLIFSAEVTMLLVSYVMAIFLGPGDIPRPWRPTPIDKYQYCVRCENYKPPRAHHCRICDVCVLKMDHHCPWINGCVGHKNHKSFILFLFYTTAASLHAAWIGSWKLYFVFTHGVWQYISYYMDSLYVLTVGGAVSIGLTFLLYDQMKGVFKNCTDVEGWIVAKAEYRRETEPIEPFVFPYDLGSFLNWKELMGQHWFLWGVPMPTSGDGIKWTVVEGCTQWALTEEQIEQKKSKKSIMLPVVAVMGFRGWFGCGHDWRTVWHYPALDDYRLPLDEGDRVMVSRLRNHWQYGEKTHTKTRTLSFAERKMAHGWFPSRCTRFVDAQGEGIGQDVIGPGDKKTM